mmetsp:Transcript_17249/g.47169  ORF Transcript_17249/g.47169 Transcript_17249/m.47169 type:complete len:331 (-) Transcript_17249:138-1130(-)
MQVKYVELAKSDGTRSRLDDGSDVDEEKASFNDANPSTVQSLKEFIFPGERNLGRVAIYTPPGVAGITTWVRKSPDDPLVQNMLYGYLDARPQRTVLVEPQQQLVGLPEDTVAKIENSVCVLIEDGKNFGSGFAVSNNRVYTAAHHWEEDDDQGTTYFAVKVGDKVKCMYGKPSDNKRYDLQIVKLDPRLDYCVLELTEGCTFSEWLETEISPTLKLTTPVFLAAYQIGIQERLDDYKMGLSLGITTGAIVRSSNRHLVHSCAAFKGDSGGAIVISNGKVIGLHIAAVNEAKELLDLTTIDFGSVADSINQLCDAQSSGSVALLVSAIEP